MQYDEVSFLAGLAAGRQLKGWATHIVKGDTQNRDVLAGAYGSMSTYGKYEIYDNASVSIFTSIMEYWFQTILLSRYWLLQMCRYRGI